jgi:hypothetical protein
MRSEKRQQLSAEEHFQIVAKHCRPFVPIISPPIVHMTG